MAPTLSCQALQRSLMFSVPPLSLEARPNLCSRQKLRQGSLGYVLAELELASRGDLHSFCLCWPS